MADNFSMDGGQGLYKKEEAPKEDLNESAGDAFILDIGQRERKTRGYNVDQVCIQIYICVYICVSRRTLHIYICLYIYVCIICIYIYMFIYMYVCMNINESVYIHTYIYIYVYVA